MLDFFSRLFDTTGFPPRWLCGAGWTPAHGWLHILSDVAIWAAYFTIPGILVYFAAHSAICRFAPCSCSSALSSWPAERRT
ncbi:MAG: hypothetical protein QM775_19570 [Pirellulales bacterium]